MDHSAQDALPPTSAVIDAITVGVIGSVPDRQFGFARKNGDLYKKDSMDLKKYDSFADFGTLLWTLLINGAV